MLNRIISWSIKNPFLVILGTLAAGLFGYWAMTRTPLDALPDLSDVQVIVQTDYNGQAPRIVEDQVTYPVAAEMLKVPGAKTVRGYSFFGVSFVYVIFDDGTDLYWARSRVLEYLSGIKAKLPGNVTPVLGPDATGLGWVYEYALEDTSGRMSLADLRSLQDWNLRYALTGVPGVSEVASVGGFQKQYQVDVDPAKLLAYGIPITKVMSAIRNANSDVGAMVMELSEREHMIRGLGYLESVGDIQHVTVGATEEDLAAAKVVRRFGAPVRLVANKVDDAGREGAAWELVSLGLGDPWPVSALHGRGTGDLLDEVVRLLPAPEPAPEPTAEEPPGAPRVALVGRPNVGKSTLFNRLIGEERAVVHDMPGTTRDAIDTVVTTPEGPLCFVDTAGMRRPARTERGPESYSVLRALDALERADLALLVIDATVGATHQDQRLAERIGASGCPTVVVLNKWDLIATGDREDVLAGVGDRLAFLGPAPVLRVSATSGRGAHKILPALHAAVESYHHRVPTGALNRALREIQSAHPAPGARIRYAVQGAIDPPTFTLFANGRLPQTYLRYVERGLRERFDLGSTPLKLRVRT